MRARNAPRELNEQRLHDFLELLRLHNVEDFFKLVQEHDLLGTVHFRPISEQALDNLVTTKWMRSMKIDMPLVFNLKIYTSMSIAFIS